VDKNLRAILQQLEAEKNINRHTLIEAIRSAIESAARKNMPDVAEVMVDVDPEEIDFKVFEVREVVEEVTDPTVHISLEAALEKNPNAEVGNRLKIEAQPQDFGRIAAQTAKQVIIQKIKDAERDNIYEEFKKREGEMVTGVVKRHSQGNLIVMVDKAEAIIPPREQAVRETFRPNDRIRAILIAVEKSARGAQIILSRATPDLVRALFEMEVPEIFDETIEIKAIAREAGSRTKVAVQSNDPNVDAVGACVGMKGSRVRTVVEELSGEKIDIVRWSDNPIELCGHALNPADILDITLDEEAKTVSVTVPHDQLSLAIGKKGQNARLASRLIGWNIDIISDGVAPVAAPPVEDEPVETETVDSATTAPDPSTED
jgi:transcription termination/antitermination protein NusA